ncbi:MAG: hypothetical protein TREMPRED_005111, partial [Tremellales sp. Tagirdzhanova-0007]
VFESLVEEKVVVAPSAYFRSPSISDSSIEDEVEEMEEGARRMGIALAREWKCTI